MYRNHEVKLKIDSKEKEVLEKKAKELGLKISQYIRMVSINAKLNIEK